MNGDKRFIAAMILLGVAVCVTTSCARKPRVWIYASMYKEVIAEMKPLLEKALPPDVEVMWFQGGSENIASKVNAELAAGRTRADIILTSDPFWYYELKMAGMLLPYECAAASGVPGYFMDPDRHFAGVRLPVMVIAYNPNAIGEKDVPRSWKDLIGPPLKGRVSMPNPLESGSAFTAVAMLQRAFGWDYFRELRARDLLVAGGNSSVITRMETGERPVGIVLLENVLKARRKGSPVLPVYPLDGTIPVISPIAIMKDSRRPELARKIYDWFFTDEAQRAITAGYMYSPLKRMPAPPGGREFAQLEPGLMPWSLEIQKDIYSRRQELKNTFTDILLR
jgi:iron(III) transport system substrate-binding protein